jgi:tripartite-type tricarboxylate transporter receptor subunit TctC
MLSVLTLALGVGSAMAQTWPSRTVTLTVGVPPGSAPDAYARTIAERMARDLGQQVIVETRAGANGNLAAEFVLRAPADGHTLWIAAQSMVEINPSAYDELRWKPSDFAGVIKGAEAPLVLVVHPTLPARTMAELEQWLRANPTRAMYGSFGGGTTSQFAGTLLAERMGLTMTHVPFNGSAPQTQNLIGGHVLFGFTQIQSGVPHIREGRLIAIATTGATRWRQLPATPTLIEAGFKGLVATTWFGIMARASTPPETMDRVIEAARRAHADPELRGKLEAMGLDVSGLSGAAFDEDIRAGLARWGAMVKATGFKASQ